MEIKQALLEQIDAVSPEYKAAREIFEQGSPQVTELQKGIVGQVAGIKDTQILRAGNVIFNPKTSAPEVVKQARSAIESANPEAWRALTRAHLQETFENIAEAATTSTPNIGGLFRKAVFGSQKRRAMLQAALEPKEFAALNRLMAVLDATGRAVREPSETAFFQEIARELRGDVAGLLPKAIAPQRIPGALMDFWQEVRFGKHATKMAQVILSPTGQKELARLHQVGVNSARAILGTFQLLTQGAKIELEGPPRGAPKGIPDQPASPSFADRERPVRTRQR